MKPGRWGALLLVMLVPVVALAGRVFQWTDKDGVVHATDNLWELPEAVRTRYLELIEVEARQKYKPEQIRQMKEDGNWPPVEFIRPKALEAAAQATEWMGFKLGGSDAETQRALMDEWRFQWNSFFEERKRLQKEIPAQEQAVKALEEELLLTRNQDAMLARMGPMAQAPAVAERLLAATKKLEAMRVAQTQLPQRERALHLGKRSYFHPGEDGGPATFSN